MKTPMLVAGLGLAIVATPGAPVLAQGVEPPPFAPHEWTYGRRLDESQLRYCVDSRDGDWEVAGEIADAIAGGLLLEPVRYVVENEQITQEFEDIYAVMLEHCDLHMGFKLLADAYPYWLTVTRAYYQARYVFVTVNPDWRSLGDVPPGRPIGAAMATTADLRLITYIMALTPEKRWPRFPMGTNQQALEALVGGTVDVALVWEPELWALQKSNPAYADLRVIDSEPLPETVEGVAGVMLSDETFLRTAVDEAITALIPDGTIQSILDKYKFPATAKP